ncbi:MAG: hypothetical protein AAFQ61_10105 [Cyanobacteria bacterium J06626_23]
MVATPISVSSSNSTAALLNGEVLIETHPHTATGAAVTAQMYVPVVRSHLWEQLTDYSRAGSRMGMGFDEDFAI